MLLSLASHNTVVILKVGRYVDDVNGRLQAMSPMRSRQQWKCEQPRQSPSLQKCRRKKGFWRRLGSISERPKSLDDVFNVTAILCCLFIVEHTNIANTNQLCDTFEKSTWRIGDVICVAMISYTKCIFEGTQKMFVVLPPNAITTQKKNQDRTLIQTDDPSTVTRVSRISRFALARRPNGLAWEDRIRPRGQGSIFGLAS